MLMLKMVQPLERSFTLSDLLVIGSDPSCQVQVEVASLDDRHARIEKREKNYIIRDLRSSLGTFVNGTQVLEAILQPGDLLKMGDAEFIFANSASDLTDKNTLSSKNEEWSAELSTLTNLSRTRFPILLLGPSGTGKEVVSQTIHNCSLRDSGPFVSVNCSALTETLVESELFGHVKGSFTGAICDRKGAFESARGGTLFLDEIGDLPYGLQAKLLRALENNEIRPVGSDRTIKTDVRIIAATHQNLLEKISEGSFRSDLYYRLNVLTLNLPALSERMEDFETLLYTFAKHFRVRFSHMAIQKLKAHKWPGNIRELKNLVARASAIFPQTQVEEIHIERLIDKNSNSQQKSLLATSSASTMPVIKEIEKQMIIKRLHANGGNQRRTALDLGMPKSTLHDRLKIYDIDPTVYRPGYGDSRVL